MKIFRWFVILMAMTLEVRLKAAQQEPPECLSRKELPCSLFAFEPTRVKTKHVEMTLTVGAILYREKSGEWNFVSGTVRIANSKEIRLKTKIGAILLGPGIRWTQWRDEKLWIYSLEGTTDVKLFSSLLQVNAVPAGFYNWYGFVDKNGRNEQGMPRRIEPAVINSVLPGFKKHQDRKLVVKGESRSIAMASEFYHDIAQQMEDQATQRNQEAELRESRRIELEKRARDLFRQKYLGPVEFPDGDPESQN